MKKVLFLVAALALLAAACNKTSQTSTAPATSQNTAQAQVDATVNDLNASIDSETTTNTQSDTDVLKTDQSVVNDSEGVSNANY